MKTKKKPATGVDKIDDSNPDETYDMGIRNYNPRIARFDTRDMYADNSQGIELAMSLADITRYAFTGGNLISYGKSETRLLYPCFFWFGIY
ncbi:hypothetical protein IC620_15055 [Hazenella sp. IB182357]|uniref:Uncharacterized protein n=1 Tax=Polycladospora coralii TaxID=2771432 RepID=A0A926RVJ2_9BACL|nr:hypothetical protein [Polycladospora coralii]MBD1373664.1 hypothetical protein [Polycladospora coralii]